MKNYAIDNLRNVAFVSHGGTGKTTLAEAMLFAAGSTKRLGNVDNGTSLLDYDPEEVRRNITINASTAHCEWNDVKVNILDTPGYFDFAGDVLASLRVADGAVVAVCASSGVEVGTERAWEFLDREELPRMVFISKMDRENADFNKVVADLQNVYGNKLVPFQLPVGSAENLAGIVDLLSMKAYTTVDGNVTETDIPDDMVAEAEEARETMIEAISVADEELMEKYLEGDELTQAEIEKALALGTKQLDIIPILCGAASKNVGIINLLDYCVNCLPSPRGRNVAGVDPKSGEDVDIVQAADGKLCALVYKTMADPYVGKLTLFRVVSGCMTSDSSVYNAAKEKDERVGQLFVIQGKEQIPVEKLEAGDLGAVAKLQTTTTNDTLCAKDRPLLVAPIEFPKPVMSMAVSPKAKGDEEKIGSGLTRLSEEDPTFTIQKNAETNQLVISGLGDLHLEVMCSRLQKKFGVEVELTTPRVPYRETIRGKTTQEGKHKKQSGGRGQFGHVVIELEAKTEESDDRLQFVDKIFGGAVPRQYIPAVEKGIRETMDEGVMAGYPVVDIQVTLTDGSYHSVDSSEMAFKIAASMAFKTGFMQAKPTLLEPVMNVEILVPEAYMGDVMGDLNKKRGRIMGMDSRGTLQVIRAQVPMSEMFRYAIDLRSMTQGRASFSMDYSHYEEVPAQIAEQVVADSQKEDE